MKLVGPSCAASARTFGAADSRCSARRAVSDGCARPATGRQSWPRGRQWAHRVAAEGFRCGSRAIHPGYGLRPRFLMLQVGGWGWIPRCCGEVLIGTFRWTLALCRVLAHALGLDLGVPFLLVVAVLDVARPLRVLDRCSDGRLSWGF